MDLCVNQLGLQIYMNLLVRLVIMFLIRCCKMCEYIFCVDALQRIREEEQTGERVLFAVLAIKVEHLFLSSAVS